MWNKFLTRNIILILILFLAALLRFYHLGEESFWHDEIYAAMFAQGSVIDVIRRYLGEMHWADNRFILHHLAYVFINLMSFFSSQQFVLLLPGTIFSILSIGLIYGLGRLLFNTQVGLMAAFFLTVSPFHLYYSQELLYYPYLIFFSLLTYLAICQLMRNPSRKNLIFFLTATVLNILTHLAALFVLTAEMIFVGLTNPHSLKKLLSWIKLKIKSKRRQPLFLLFVVILIFLLGWFFLSWARIILLSWVNPGKAVPRLEFSWSFFVKLASLYTTTNLKVLWFYVAFFVLGLIPTRKSAKSVLFCVIILVFPFLWFYLAGFDYSFDPRYVSFIVPIFFLAVSLGLWRLINFLSKCFGLKPQDRLLAAIISIILGVLFFFGARPEIINFYQTRLMRTYQPGKGMGVYGIVDDWKGLASYLEENEKERELIIVDQNMNTSGLAFYYRGKNHFTTYNFEKKPLFIKRLGAAGHGWFICHWDCPIEEISKNDFPTVAYIFKKEIPSEIWVYQIIPKANLVFMADMDKFSQNKDWQIIPDNQKTFSEFLKIDSYFPWQGKEIRMLNAYANTTGATVSYGVEFPVSGFYNLYVNLSEESSGQFLSWQLEGQQWKKNWEITPVRKLQKTVDLVSGRIFIARGKHTVGFRNSADGKSIEIHYFFLVPEEK